MIYSFITLLYHITIKVWDEIAYPLQHFNFAYSTLRHYLTQCWVIIDWTLRNKLQWNFNQNTKLSFTKMHLTISSAKRPSCPGSAFIKPDQRNPWIKDQIKITLLPTISHLLLPNFVSCGRACPSHMTQNLVTVGAKLWTADRFIVDPWSMDYADPVW